MNTSTNPTERRRRGECQQAINCTLWAFSRAIASKAAPSRRAALLKRLARLRAERDQLEGES